MTNKQDLLDVISKSFLPNAFEYAEEIMAAYEELDKLGESEFIELKLAYLHGRVASPLKKIFHDYLMFNGDALKQLEQLKVLIVTAKNITRGEVSSTDDSPSTVDIQSESGQKQFTAKILQFIKPPSSSVEDGQKYAQASGFQRTVSPTISNLALVQGILLSGLQEYVDLIVNALDVVSSGEQISFDQFEIIINDLVKEGAIDSNRAEKALNFTKAVLIYYSKQI